MMDKVVPIRPGVLIKDTTDDRVVDFFSTLTDIETLVQDRNISRAELRCIEDFDDEVQQCADTRLDALLGVDWRLDGPDTRAKKRTAQAVKAIYRDLVTGAWRSLLYGYSVIELMYQQDDKFFYPVKAVEKPFEWFNVDKHGVLYYKSYSNFEVKGVPVDQHLKFVLTRNKPTYTRPYGRPLLASLYWPTFFRYAGWRYWMQFLERTGQPMLAGFGADPGQIAKQLRAALMDAVIGMPADGKVEILGTKSNGESFNLVEAALIKRIQKVLLGQTLTSDTGANGVGSKALGEVHNDVRAEKTVADVNLVQPAVQQVVDAIYRINYPGQEPPRVIYSVEQSLEMGRATRDATLVNTGNMRFNKVYFQRAYGLQDDEFEVIDPAAKPAKSDNATPSEQNKQKDQPAKNDSNNRQGAN